MPTIPYEERRAVYEAAIAQYGMRSQIWMAVEEMSELTKELAKLNRHKGTTVDALVDEIADVTIMMEQLRIVFRADEKVQARIDFKVHRLQERLSMEQGITLTTQRSLPTLTPTQTLLLKTFAEYNMVVSKTAEAMNYSRGSLYHQMSTIQERTGLDPLNFQDLHMLLTLYAEEAGKHATV